MSSITVMSLSFLRRGSIVFIDNGNIPHIVKEVYIKVRDDNETLKVQYFVLQEDNLHGKIVTHGDPGMRDVSHYYEDCFFKAVYENSKNKMVHPMFKPEVVNGN